MNQLQEEILKVLVNLDKICKEHDIEYALYGGTFLGAVRHKGYIPWDDDVDVILTREEFTKLDKVLRDQSNLPEGYYYQSIETSKKYANSTPKLRSNTLNIQERMPTTQEPQVGPWVDLFIWDNIPDTEEEQRAFFKKIKRIDLIIFITTFLQKDPNGSGLKNSIKGIVQKINEMLHPLYFFVYPLLRKRDKLIQSYNNQDTKYVGNNSYCYYRDYEEYSHEIHLVETLKEFDTYSFENHNLPSYKDYDTFLEVMYGDYMTLPDEENRVTHNIEY